MIEIKVSGFKDQTIEFEQPTKALLFLTELRQEHADFLQTKAVKLEKPPNYPSYFKSSFDVTSPVYIHSLYKRDFRKIAEAHPLKVKITEFDDDMSDFI